MTRDIATGLDAPIEHVPGQTSFFDLPDHPDQEDHPVTLTPPTRPAAGAPTTAAGGVG